MMRPACLLKLTVCATLLATAAGASAAAAAVDNNERGLGPAPASRPPAEAAGPPATAEDEGAKRPLAPPSSVHDEAFDETFKKATQGWMADPLRYIEGDMSHVVGELTALKTDQPVQQRQGVVLTRLDAVIRQLEKECKSGGGGGGGGRPLGQSVIAKGPGGEGNMHDPKAGEKQWASLPPKQREQILQSRTEGFPAGFEAILQSYYERLAQEQVDESAAAAGAAAPDGGAK